MRKWNGLWLDKCGRVCSGFVCNKLISSSFTGYKNNSNAATLNASRRILKSSNTHVTACTLVDKNQVTDIYTYLSIEVQQCNVPEECNIFTAYPTWITQLTPLLTYLLHTRYTEQRKGLPRALEGRVIQTERAIWNTTLLLLFGGAVQCKVLKLREDIATLRFFKLCLEEFCCFVR
jgi:hypothetical protein